MAQQGDVKLFQTTDDGDISVVGGVVEMSSGLGTSAYMSLFGGNEHDDGRPSSVQSWWGNAIEPVQARQYRSETQNLLKSIPLTPSNLKRLQDAAERDLSWFLTAKVASSVTVLATIPALNRVKFTIDIEANGEESSFEFVENWRATQ